MAKKVATGIVLQGGGAFGAYEFGVMKALFEKRGPNFKPAVVTGLSIGAINAAVIAGAKDDPITALGEIWFKGFTILDNLPPEVQTLYDRLVPQFIQQHLSSFGNEAMYSLRPEYLVAPLVAPYITQSICDTTPLRRTLETLLDFEKLNRYQDTNVVLTAVNIATGELASFCNKDTKLTADHILASGSLPPGFPMTKIGDHYYWDGGLNSNTPLAPAISCLSDLDVDEREIVVVEIIPMQGKIPNNLNEGMGRVVELIFASKFRLDRNLFDSTNESIDLVRAMAARLDKDDPIRQQPAFKRLMRKQKIDRLIVVSPTRTDPGAGGSDFSKQTIRRRFEYGYEDGLQRLNDLEKEMAESAIDNL